MKAERQHREATSRVIQPSKGGGGHIVDNRPTITSQAKMIDCIHQKKSSPYAIIQKEDRRLTTYATHPGNHNLRDKNMEIIDSTDPSDYVHISRSTTTDPGQFNIHGPLPDGVTYNVGASRYEKREQAPAANPHFNYNLFNQANNGHITLEGRYKQVLKRLTELSDERVAIKMGPPTVPDYVNLNFGPTEHPVSNYSIEQYIENTADVAEEKILRNKNKHDNVLNDEDIQELVDVVTAVKESTSEFTNHLITSTPYLNDLQNDDLLSHYSGEAWGLYQI